MKKIITSTIVCCTAMLVGKSYAMDVKPFIGANIGINGVAYDEDVFKTLDVEDLHIDKLNNFGIVYD